MRIMENKTVDPDPEIATVVLRQSDINVLVALVGNSCGGGANSRVAEKIYTTLLPFAKDWEKIVSKEAASTRLDD